MTIPKVTWVAACGSSVSSVGDNQDKMLAVVWNIFSHQIRVKLSDKISDPHQSPQTAAGIAYKSYSYQ